MTAELRLFGGAALVGADGRPVGGGAAQPRRVAVLAVLAEAWPAAVTRDRIIGLLWPDHDDAGARRLLTQALYALRRELGDFTHATGRDLAIDADRLRVDLIEFRRALEAGDLARAATIARAPLLDGFHLRDALEFERWADALRDQATRQLHGALERLVEERTRAGDAREAARWGERLVEVAPFGVAAVLRLMDAWEDVGDPGAALAAAATYERRMREELGVEPDPAVPRRAAEIRARGTGAAIAPRERAPRDDGRVTLTDDATPLVRHTPPPTMTPGPLLGETGAAVARRSLARTLGAIALAAGALAAVALPVVRARGARGAPGRTVWIEAVSVRGDAVDRAALGGGVTSIVRTNLDGAGGAAVVRAPVRVQGVARAWAWLAGDEAPWATLRTAAFVSGGRLRLDAELAPRGTAPVKVSVVGARDSMIDLAEQLSARLLPALYPELDEALREETRGRFARAAMLRRALDGEAALRRGAYDEAYEAFRAATTIDSTSGWAWYRRAVAAEQAHRNPDADHSVAAAERRAATLTERERRLLRGYAWWRAGDTRRAEPVLRALAGSESRDREAWFQLAEIAYHAGPLVGRSPDGARDDWRQVVRLDPGNYPALMHAIRLEARAGDTASVARLLARADSLHPSGVPGAESRVVAAYGVGTPAAVAAVQPLLDTLPDYSVDFLQGVVGGLLERPEAARGIAARLVAPSRPDAVQAQGHVALAHLAMAGGRWREAWRELDQAARLNPVAAAWSRAWFATLPFVTLPDSVRAAAARELATTPTSYGAAPLYLQLAVDAPAARVIEAYLAEQLRLAGAPGAGGATLACAAADSATAGSTRELCLDLRAGLAAEAAWRRGAASVALERLESLGMRVPYQFAGRSVFFARTRERWRRAEALARAGRTAEAAAWYAGAGHEARFDVVFLAPAHLRLGELRERAGDAVAAAAHYRRVLELWRVPDPELAPLRAAAEAGLRRVGR